MLMRTDPFREFDRMAERLLGNTTRPVAMPMDAYRDDGEFVIQLDLPGVDSNSIDLEVERNILTVKATRPVLDEAKQREAVVNERPAGVFSRQVFLGEQVESGWTSNLDRRRSAIVHVECRDPARRLRLRARCR